MNRNHLYLITTLTLFNKKLFITCSRNNNRVPFSIFRGKSAAFVKIFDFLFKRFTIPKGDLTILLTELACVCGASNVHGASMCVNYKFVGAVSQGFIHKTLENCKFSEHSRFRRKTLIMHHIRIDCQQPKF